MDKSESIQSHVHVAVGLSLSIATTSVVVRLIARRLQRQQFFLDDLLIFVALVSIWKQLLGLKLTGSPAV